MRTTNSNSPGPTYGILDCGSSSYFSSTVNGNTFKGNTIQNFYYYGIYLNYVNGETVEGNDLSRANATSNNAYSYLYGIYSYYSYGIQIVKNNVHDLPFKGATVLPVPTMFTVSILIITARLLLAPLLLTTTSWRSV